jgi:Transmembrane secretion effector
VAFENFRSKFNPLLAFPRLGGVLADRVPRARVLYGTQALAMLLATLLAILTLTGPVEPWYILVLSFLSASILAFDGPARQALLPDLVSSDNLMSAMSHNGWSFNAAILIGPSLAAALVPAIGLAGAFALNAGSYGAVLVALSLLLAKEGIVPLGTARENLLKGLRYVGRSPVILALVLMVAVVSFMGRAYGQRMPVFARDFLTLDASGMNVMYTAAGLGFVVGASGLVLLHNPRKKG